MNWPSLSDYQEAIQNPRSAFLATELQRSQAEKNRLGIPRVRSGQFAGVYKMLEGSSAVAARVFLFANPQRDAHYQAVNNYLEQVDLPAFVKSSYTSHGIKVRGKVYPLQTMQWVQGQTLDVWMRDAVQKRAFQSIIDLADRWIQLMKQLQNQRISHSDLQHGNIMVDDGKLILVDYDGMYVPTLQPQPGSQSIPAPEVGRAGYQHPHRDGQPLHEHLDHFSAWIILLALRGTAADPSLWERYVTATGNENLLFTARDMIDFQESPLWADLKQSPDPEVRAWAGLVYACLDKPFADIPPFQPDALKQSQRADDTGARKSPDSAEPDARVQQLRGELEHLIHDWPILDIRIAEVWDELCELHGPIDDSEIRRLGEESVRVRDCLRKLDSIPNDLPIDEHDELWKRYWDDDLLEDRHDADRYLARNAAVRERDRMWRMMIEALDRLNPAAINRAWRDWMSQYPPAQGVLSKIHHWRQHALAVDALVDKLYNPNTAELSEPEWQLLFDHEREFHSHEAAIHRMLQLPLDQLRLKACDPAWGIHPARGTWAVYWYWPRSVLPYDCLLAYSPDGFWDHPDEVPDDTNLVRERVYRKHNGITLEPLPGVRSVYVSVWPVVDTVWCEHVGPPIHIGPVPVGNRKRKGKSLRPREPWWERWVYRVLHR